VQRFCEPGEFDETSYDRRRIAGLHLARPPGHGHDERDSRAIHELQVREVDYQPLGVAAHRGVYGRTDLVGGGHVKFTGKIKDQYSALFLRFQRG
jgi:hypothetical protein